LPDLSGDFERRESVFHFVILSTFASLSVNSAKDLDFPGDFVNLYRHCEQKARQSNHLILSYFIFEI